MSQVLVTGAGRSGTYVVFEMLAANDHFIKPPRSGSGTVEDKSVFSKKLVPNYLGRLDIGEKTIRSYISLLDREPKLKIVWPIRDLRDLCMSLMYRGAETANRFRSFREYVETRKRICYDTMEQIVLFYSTLKNVAPTRVRHIKLEDALSRPIDTANDLCNWIGIRYDRKMTEFYKTMGNKDKKRRYKTIDVGEIRKWTRLKSEYNNFFEERKINMEELFSAAIILNTIFGYTRERGYVNENI